MTGVGCRGSTADGIREIMGYAAVDGDARSLSLYSNQSSRGVCIWTRRFDYHAGKGLCMPIVLRVGCMGCRLKLEAHNLKPALPRARRRHPYHPSPENVTHRQGRDAFFPGLHGEADPPNPGPRFARCYCGLWYITVRENLCFLTDDYRIYSNVARPRGACPPSKHVRKDTCHLVWYNDYELPKVVSTSDLPWRG